MSLQSDFQQLHQLLRRYQDYWQLMPFAQKSWPWSHPQLQQQLASLTDQQVAELDRDPANRQAYLIDLFPELASLPEIKRLPVAQPSPELPFWLSNGIPGRKVGQISQFCQRVTDSSLPVLEWCAGKGHLGRMLAYSQQRQVQSLEWQLPLCQQGQQLAEKYQLSQQFIHADALSAQGSAALKPAQQVLALHACGELHLQLLRAATEHDCQHVQLVPCCYHLIPQPFYQPISQQGQQRDLVLSQHDLKLAVQGQVTAGARIARLRHQEVEWRLAFQALRANITGQPHYQPLNSVAKHIFSGDFIDFARWAAEQHQLTLPEALDSEYYLEQGRQHAQLVRRIELVRHLFQRPLELWLLHDRALFLQQQGYQVELGTFCPAALTPRNLMIRASKE
ncbi:methyltransferase [Alkalimonas collagenimarina]|uniref:Methyltransferase n=1 Tax=Alkalimonas collagenimarina TaxID=400390 RepID=A0ABT9GXY6_9GAMM|nr:methyltransferase [Alkalimonas collagenimarina]MDP4535922.1 methyltransferase [Alkalimonas collagenimarina]